MSALLPVKKFSFTLLLMGCFLAAPMAWGCGYFCTEFFWARVNPEWMEKMLAEDPGATTAKTGSGHSSLHLAAIYAVDLEALRMFLQAKGANPNVVDPNGYTPLFYSVQRNPDPAVTEVFLQEGARPNAKEVNNQTPLFVAQRAELVRVLAAHGADPNVKNKGGVHPLLAAILKKWDATVVEALLEAKADPDVKYSGGFRPLHYTILEKSDADTVRAVAKWAKKPNALDDNNMAALHYAAREGASVEVVEAMLEGPKVDVNVANHLGVTPCAMAEMDNPKIVPVLKGHEKYNGDC